MGRLLKISILPCVLLVIAAGVFLRTEGAGAASPQTCGAWSTVFSPNPSTIYNALYGVAAVSANDVWAVGFYKDNSTFADLTLTAHWNGSRWSVVSSPTTGEDSFLQGVAATSATNAWAVGYYETGSTNLALIERWNGTSWNIVSNPAPSGSELYGVTAFSANDVWAVGDYNYSSGNYHTLIEHWDGTSWSVIASPNPGAVDNTLRAVARVPGTQQVWAVGYYQSTYGGSHQSLIERWNGTSWKVVASPSPGSGDNNLYGVTAISASDVWAVGFYYNTNGPQQTLTEQWNGSNWSVVASPNVPGAFGDVLFATAALSVNNVWAVGYYTNGSGLYQTLTEQWNGTTWSIVSSPNKGTHYNFLFGVSGISRAGGVWTVGYYTLKNSSTAPNRTLTEFYC